MEESKIATILKYLSNSEAQELISQVIKRNRNLSRLDGFRPTWADNTLLHLRYKLYDFLEEEELYFQAEEQANRHFVEMLIRAGYVTIEEIKRRLTAPAALELEKATSFAETLTV